jgi:hypothetical protein
MQYKKYNDKIVKILDIGETISVEKEIIDEKTGEKVIETTHYPFYTKECEYPTKEFTENLKHDLNRIKQELESKVIEYNTMIVKIDKITQDVPEVIIEKEAEVEVREKV